LTLDEGLAHRSLAARIQVVSDADTVLMSKDQNLVLGARALGIATADLGDRSGAGGESLSPDPGPGAFPCHTVTSSAI